MGKDFVAINLNNNSSYPPSTRFFCSLCNCKLSSLNNDKDEFVCTRCNISYYPTKGEKVKRANKFATPGPNTDDHGNITGDKMPIVSMINDSQKLSSSYKSPKLSPFFKELVSRPGVNLLDYQTSED